MLEQIIGIVGSIVGAEEGELDADLDLFESGLLDSFGIIQLFVALEERFGTAPDIETLTRRQIATPALIARCMEQAL